MALPTPINFAPGVTVTITMEDNSVFTGELIDATGNFVQLRLLQPPGTLFYTAGQVIRFNLSRLLAIA
jgi:hypothetical protein